MLPWGYAYHHHHFGSGPLYLPRDDTKSLTVHVRDLLGMRAVFNSPRRPNSCDLTFFREAVLVAMVRHAGWGDEGREGDGS